MKMYSMKDLKMGEFSPVLMGMNDAHVSRIIAESFQGQNHTVSKFPGDYDLYEVGDFSLESGVVTSELRFVTNVSVILNGGKDA